ncbi:MAG: hypothetical protein NTW08_05135 [Gammaproteobacteria bacterium]|nr:hypothetical protein [Gammaproteobacteria bacterium]
MPEYKDTPLYTKLKELRNAVDSALILMKKNKSIPPIELKTTQYIHDYLELINDVCKYFDNNQLLTSVNALKLAARLGLARKLFTEESYDKILGTPETHLFMAIESKLKEHTDYPKEKMIANLTKHKEAMFKGIQNEFGSIDLINMNKCFDELLAEIQKNWMPGKENVNELCNQLLQPYFINHTAHEVKINTPELAGVVKLALESVESLPTQLHELLPFFNPKSIEVDTQKPSSVMVSVAKQFLPRDLQMHLASLGKIEDPFSYLFQLVDKNQTVILEDTYNFQAIVDAQRSRFLPMVSNAVREFEAKSTPTEMASATQRGTFFSSNLATSASPSSVDGLTNTNQDSVTPDSDVGKSPTGSQ